MFGETVTIPIEVPCDEDGYVMLQCPLCGKFFKLLPEELHADDVVEVCCPYCGLISDSYLTDDVKELALTVAKNELLTQIDTAFDDMKNRFKNNKFISLETKKLTKEEEPELYELMETLDMKKFDCCGKTAKIYLDAKESFSYCPYCGVITFGNK